MQFLVAEVVRLTHLKGAPKGGTEETGAVATAWNFSEPKEDKSPQTNRFHQVSDGVNIL